MSLPVKQSDYSLLDSFLQDPNTMKMQRMKEHTKFHLAMLVSRGKIIQIAPNKLGDRSNGCGYAERTIHAERNVIKQLGNTNLIRGCDMYVMKIHQHKTTGEKTFCYSKPCHGCQVFINKCQKQYGLNNVYYTEFPQDAEEKNHQYVNESNKSSACSKAPSIQACLNEKLSPHT